MRIRTILAAAAAPAALAAVLLGTAGQASAAVTPAPSAYYYNPSGNALGGPHPTSFGSEVPFGSAALAKVTEKTNNQNINNQVITIKGHMNTPDQENPR